MERFPERRVRTSEWMGLAERRAEFKATDSLESLDLLQVLQEPEFQELAELASQICDTPMSLITLLGAEKQWITSSIGTALRETSREVAFCGHAIKTPSLFVVEDASKDERFAANPLVTGAMGIRFYAGIPLNPPQGSPFGTLCVIDTKARQMTDKERASLEILGRQVQTRLELRAKQRKLERALEENERLSTTLQETNELFMTFMENAPLASYIKDEDGRLLFYNRMVAERYGVSPEEWLGLTNYERYPAEVAERIHADDEQVLRGGVLTVKCEKTPDTQGRMIYWKSYKFPFRRRNGKMMLAGMSLDVTEDVLRERGLEEENRQLEVLAGTDALTGLPNRRFFESRATSSFVNASERGQALSLLVLDVDDFKKRNDQLGHAAGDDALRQIGGLLKNLSSDDRVAARIGGEEFALLMPGVEGEDARRIAEELLKGLRAVDGGPMKLTASIGVACLDGLALNWERLMARADDAMYEAKRQGKNRVLLHEDLVAKMMTEMRHRRRPGRSVRAA